MTVTTGTVQARSALDAFAVTVMIVLTLSWGVNQVAIKLGNVGYNPVFSVLIRSAIGGVLVWCWCLYRGIKLFERDGTLWPGIAVGVLFGIEFALIFVGLDYTTAARSTLMLNTMPFWVLLGAHFTLGERMSLLKFSGLALAFAGVTVVFSDELSAPGPDALIGDLMCLIAGILWALTTLLVKGSRLTDASPEKTLLYQLAVSAVFLIPFVPLAGPILRDVNLLATGSLIFQSVFIVAVTYLVWFWLMRRYPASGLSSFAFLTPAFGVVSAGLLLNEPLSIRIFIALALIAVGLAMVNRPVRRTLPG